MYDLNSNYTLPATYTLPARTFFGHVQNLEKTLFLFYLSFISTSLSLSFLFSLPCTAHKDSVLNKLMSRKKISRKHCFLRNSC